VTDLVIVIAIGVVALAGGVALGMLVAPRLSRIGDRDDEDVDDDRAD
jgi:hypothetical protein